MRRLTRSRIVVIVVGISSIATFGCNSRYSGAVSGTVTYQGKKLTLGRVGFIHPDGRFEQASIKEDGTYTVPMAPGGDVKVIVVSDKPQMPVPGGIRIPGGGVSAPNPHFTEEMKQVLSFRPIPEKYRDAQSTPLRCTVKRGSQDYNIELTD